ncbi:SIR2 family protein [Serratia marcescens]|nr:SIR2 family protein [Serratia marcescens]
MDSKFDYDGLESKNETLGLEEFSTLSAKINNKRVCLFLGAGFSKAWDNDYPLSDDVFSITEAEAAGACDEYGFFTLFEGLNFKWGSESIDKKERASIFKSFKHTMDIYRRYPSLLPSHLDKQTIDMFECQIKRYIKNKFTRTLHASECDLTTKGALNKNKANIINFFKALSNTSSLDVITTNYDIVIDKVINKAYPDRTILRGFPVHINNELQCPKKGGIGLYKLNGGFEVIEKNERFRIDYSSLQDEKIAPNIILPSNEQDYSDKYFKNAFIKSSGQLRHADVLIFIGYSFPDEDYIIQFLLKTFLDSDNSEKETIIISRSEESAINCHKRACNVFRELNDKSGLYYYKGSFLDLCKNI